MAGRPPDAAGEETPSGKPQPAPLRREVIIRNPRGLHARAAAKFVESAGGFDAEIQVSREGQSVPGTSIMGLLMLTAGPGVKLIIEASGSQAEEAIAALAGLVEGNFGE